MDIRRDNQGNFYINDNGNLIPITPEFAMQLMNQQQPNVGMGSTHINHGGMMNPNAGKINTFNNNTFTQNNVAPSVLGSQYQQPTAPRNHNAIVGGYLGRTKRDVTANYNSNDTDTYNINSSVKNTVIKEQKGLRPICNLEIIFNNITIDTESDNIDYIKSLLQLKHKDSEFIATNSKIKTYDVNRDKNAYLTDIVNRMLKAVGDDVYIDNYESDIEEIRKEAQRDVMFAGVLSSIERYVNNIDIDSKDSGLGKTLLEINETVSIVYTNNESINQELEYIEGVTVIPKDSIIGKLSVKLDNIKGYLYVNSKSGLCRYTILSSVIYKG